ARPGAGGNIRTAEVGGVERAPGDVDECVGGVRVDRYPPAGAGNAVRLEAGGVLGRGQQVGPVGGGAHRAPAVIALRVPAAVPAAPHVRRVDDFVRRGDHLLDLEGSTVGSGRGAVWVDCGDARRSVVVRGAETLEPGVDGDEGHHLPQVLRIGVRDDPV